MGLSPGERDELTQQLRARAASLRNEMESKRDEAAGDAVDAGARGDVGDRNFAASESEIGAGEIQRDQSELGAIERTLARIEEGTYGVCAECGADIPVGRLKAQPLASRCASCQSAREARESRLR